MAIMKQQSVRNYQLGKISGNIMIRPVRPGFVVREGLDSLQELFELATSFWGGIYSPIIQSSSPSDVLRASQYFNVDFLHIPDNDLRIKLEADSFLASQVQIKSGPLESPFEARDGDPFQDQYFRLCDWDWLLRPNVIEQTVLPVWDTADPLAQFLACWYGSFGQNPLRQELADSLRSAVGETKLRVNEPLPDLTQPLSPIDLTRMQIRYSTSIGSTALLAVDPSDATQVVQFWNARANGAAVFPWILGFEDRVHQAAQNWIRHAIQEPGLGVTQRANETNRYLAVVGDLDGQAIKLAKDTVGDSGIEVLGKTRQSYLSGLAPSQIGSAFRGRFSESVAQGERFLEVPLPFLRPRDINNYPPRGIVAAEIQVQTETEIESGYTFSLPNSRCLAELGKGYNSAPHYFHRPTSFGRAVGVNADIDSLSLEQVFVGNIFANLLYEPNWSSSVGDNSVLTQNLIQRLGGPASNRARQPAMRAVLRTAAASPHGVNIPRLVNEARKWKGNWPGPIHRSIVSDASVPYETQVVYELLGRELMLPVQHVKCVHCLIPIQISPHEISDRVHCEACRREFPLGLGIALQRNKPEWRFRIAGDLTADRVLEALPISAVCSVFASWRTAQPLDFPTLIGWEIESPNGKCEVDVAFILFPRETPTVVIGETKSFKGEFDSNDLANLRMVQRQFHSKGIDCIVLVASLKERLSSSEIAALEAFCQELPDPPSLRSMGIIRPAYPIVLVESDLSAPDLDERNPANWAAANIEGIYDLARKSCIKNMEARPSESYVTGNESGYWQVNWDRD